jgi:ATP-dependent Clp protease ATP-binding subunit ClpC
MEATGEKYTEARRAVLGRDVTEEGHSRSHVPLHVQEAERLGHDYIGCEHLLLGILADEEDVAAKILAAHGVTRDGARRRVAEIVGEGGTGSVRRSYSPRATVVSRLAEVEAERLDEVCPRHAHLLLAMLTAGAGIPDVLLRGLDVDVGKLREERLEALDVPRDIRETYLRQRIASERARWSGG